MITSLLAQMGQPTDDPLRRPEVIWGTIGLAVSLLVGAVVIWLVDRWRKRASAARTDAALELSEFRAMYQRGEITEEEYAKLRNQVAGRMKTIPAATSPPGASGPTGPATPGALPGVGVNPPPNGADQLPKPPHGPGSPANPPPPA